MKVDDIVMIGETGFSVRGVQKYWTKYNSIVQNAAQKFVERLLHLCDEYAWNRQ